MSLPRVPRWLYRRCPGCAAVTPHRWVRGRGWECERCAVRWGAAVQAVPDPQPPEAA